MGDVKLEHENMSIEDALATHGSIIWHCKGVSMKPLIREKSDYVIIERPSREIAPYDIVLYARDRSDCNDSKRDYVLHRVIKRDGDKYIILGDNCVSCEYVDADKILGVMSGLVRNRKPYNFDGIAYKAYMNLWIKPRRMRMGLTGARFRAGRVCRKILKRS